ncbi:MAG: DUF2085 domain-containing protein [Bacteroidetes bacterium]|nr:DUF2085 domain-containing protein [Bacteroidota bacterium]
MDRMFNLGTDVFCRRDAPCMRGWRFPLCWRCCGIVAGTLLGLVLVGAGGLRGIGPGVQLGLAAVWAFPAVLDYIAQVVTTYQSNYRRRLWTGLLLGCADAVAASVVVSGLLRLVRPLIPVAQRIIQLNYKEIVMAEFFVMMLIVAFAAAAAWMFIASLCNNGGRGGPR